jgi:cell division protein FtsB
MDVVERNTRALHEAIKMLRKDNNSLRAQMSNLQSSILMVEQENVRISSVVNMLLSARGTGPTT